MRKRKKTTPVPPHEKPELEKQQDASTAFGADHDSESAQTQGVNSSRPANYLKTRGIGPEFHLANHGEINPELIARDWRLRLRRDFWQSNQVALREIVEESLWFQCRTPGGSLVHWILRPFPELRKEDGTSVKFLHPLDIRPYPFVIESTWKIAKKTNHPIAITEGPCKGLALELAGQPAIAVGGVWLATVRSSKEEISLDPVLLQEFEWRGRVVYLAFDADWSENPQVRQALVRLVIQLAKVGADVRVVNWSLAEGKGIDDFLVSQADPRAAWEKLAQSAGGLQNCLRSADLLMVETELTRANLKDSILQQFSRSLAKALGASPDIIFEEVRGGQTTDAGADNKAFRPDPEPWPEPVDGSELLSGIITVIRRHIILSEAKALAVALWIMLTYLQDQTDIFPLLIIRSPMKGCGKTNLLIVVSELCSRPLLMACPSDASLYRLIDQHKVALVIDEAAEWLKDNQMARQIVLSAYHRKTAKVSRCHPVTLEPQIFSSYGPKAFAGIEKLADTLVDRSITILLNKRNRHKEPIDKMRDADPALWIELCQKLVRWSNDNAGAFRTARPDIPEVLEDRPTDNWAGQIAIGDLCAGEWPERVRTAALLLAGNNDDAQTYQVLILTELRRRYEKAAADLDGQKFLPTDHLLTVLNQGPCSDWKDPLSEHRLGKILKEFEVQSTRRHTGAEFKRGYLYKDEEHVVEGKKKLVKGLEKVFERYLRPPEKEEKEEPETEVQPPGDPF
jgi:hypothetical protein